MRSVDRALLAFLRLGALPLKGLEADHAVVFDADSMTRADIYVAMSRASRTMTKTPDGPLCEPARCTRGEWGLHLCRLYVLFPPE
jgi:hypothetical protein